MPAPLAFRPVAAPCYEPAQACYHPGEEAAVAVGRWGRSPSWAGRTPHVRFRVCSAVRADPAFVRVCWPKHYITVLFDRDGLFVTLRCACYCFVPYVPRFLCGSSSCCYHPYILVTAPESIDVTVWLDYLSRMRSGVLWRGSSERLLPGSLIRERCGIAPWG